MAFPRRLRRLPALLALCLGLSACAAPAAPARQTPACPPEPTGAVSSPEPVPDRPPALKEAPPYPDVGIYFDGLLTDKGYLVGDALYLSPETVCAFFGLDLKVEEGASLTVTAPGLTLLAEPGQEYMTANGRYLYTPFSYFFADGRLYLPQAAVERVFGVQVLYDAQSARAEIAGGSLLLIEGGKDYYESRYNSEDMFWLSRIICAEAKNEPLAGMIGVGQVVLNRVESPDFPNTVYTVIFDKNFSVQFAPTETGGVYEEPDERSVVAAYLALEGWDTVGESLYFVNPDKGADPWFERELTPTVVIGHHHFYV